MSTIESYSSRFNSRRRGGGINFRQLQQFEAIARSGSLTLAAARLNLTIPALSKSVQLLEADLGARLLERGPRGTRLTPAGLALIDHAELARNLLASARRAVEDAREASVGSVHVGAAPAAAQAVLPDAVAALRRRHPGVRISVREGLVDLPRAVRVGDLDLAVVAAGADATHPELASDVVFSERVIVVGARQEAPRQALARLARREWVLPAASNPLRVHLEACFAAAGAPAPTVAVETGSILFITALVERGGALGYLPETLCRAQLDAGTLREIRCVPLAWRRDLVVIRHAGLPLQPAARALLDIMRGAAK